VLTYFKYAPLRFSETALLGAAWPESRHTWPSPPRCWWSSGWRSRL